MIFSVLSWCVFRLLSRRLRSVAGSSREALLVDNKRRGSFHLLRENKRQKDSQRTTMMLVVVIGFFLTTEIPLLVITVLHTLDNRSVERFHDGLFD